jgi:electron transfer flavoprotein alpha/beta subunit
MPRIPWAAIPTHGPAIVAAAKHLLGTAGKSDEKNQSIEARLDQLEKGSMESARLLQEIAQQIQALTMAQEQTARKARIALAVGVAGLAVGIGAGIFAAI